MKSVKEFSPDQVSTSINEIESRYRDAFGRVNLIRMSDDRNIYATWMELRKMHRVNEAARRMDVATKVGKP